MRFSSQRILLVIVITALAIPGAQVLTGWSRHPAAAAPAERPNIIFILTDDLDAKSISVMPQLKALIADQGVTFSNFFVTDSLCCPSRSSILRGQYVHNHRVLSNAPPNGSYSRFYELGHESSTIGVWLKSAGYRTGFMGKYLNGYPGRTVSDTHVPPGWDEWDSPTTGSAYGNFNYRMNENGRIVTYGRNPDDYFTDVAARKAIEFIRRSTRDGTPFFLYLATYAPHQPATPAPRHQNQFANVTAPRSPSFNEADVSDKPGWVKRLPPLSPRQTAQIDELYRKRLQSLQAVDELIAALVGELQVSGQLARTYLVFSSDNGFHLGEHRLLVGKNTAYEEDIRVPLIVRGPGIPARQMVDHLAVNIDLAPTFAELAGAAVPAFVDGRSLVPLLRADAPGPDRWRQAFLVERYAVAPDAESATGAERATAASRPRAQGRALEFFGIRTRDGVYVEYSTGERELYDLQKDAYELDNLAGPASRDLLARLSARVADLKRCAGPACRTAEDGR